MKLTENQIQQLYQFTRDHYVEHYDLQTELVDHLANGIEKRWEENPTLSFEDALRKEFKQFGIFGFNDVIEKHTSALSKKYFKIIFRFLREYIKLPKIIGTIGAILVLFYIIRYVSVSMWIMGFMAFLGFLYFSFTVATQNRAYKKQAKKTGKRWKLEEMIFNAGNGGFFILNLFQLVYHSKILTLDHYAIQLLSAVVLVFAVLFTYISTVILPEKAEELLRETYPEYELSM